ncbi:cobalt ECF transporter T component CbiQ [Geomonas sp. RF6]|uniref:cobalt ECF transporter T component CbiQ n=1 Tax=Geomonas sp. RF6 TaxID=2897342 RepID=UPI001E506043|nr:cobalt ECF transporter T component CbiQ [Geomonas sp. RF6]UFS68676.1 cobalt ECF transporter T component CbiQ [Geomonas sp. RF6]
MASIEGALLDFKSLDRLAGGVSGLHRLDPRAKVIVTLVFIFTVVSFGRYQISALIPFFAFPIAMVALGDLPPRFLVKKVALLCPFALLVAIFNPLFDRDILIRLGSVGISAGWISCASIVLRAALTVGAALILVALTGFPDICRALERLGMPRPFSVQLLFLYRYIFVLAEDASRAVRARQLRAFGDSGMKISVYVSLLGHLLLRTWQRAERIHMAMLSRGFTGTFHTRHNYRFGPREAFFVAGWCTFFILLRLHNISQLVGNLVTGVGQ